MPADPRPLSAISLAERWKRGPWLLFREGGLFLQVPHQHCLGQASSSADQLFSLSFLDPSGPVGRSPLQTVEGFGGRKGHTAEAAESPPMSDPVTGTLPTAKTSY